MRQQDNEHKEQAALIQWCKLNEYKYPELSLLFAIPNGGHRHIAVAHKMKKEGVRSGVPDLFLPVARGIYHGLFIEMKVVGGRPSKNQAVWIENLTQQGYMTIVCFNWIVAKDAIVHYLTSCPGPPPRPAPPLKTCSKGGTKTMGLHRTLTVILLSLFLSSASFAKGKQLSGDDAEILDYIAANNPMVKTLEKATKKTWGQYLKDGLRVNLKGSYTASPTGDQFTVGGEGGVGGVGATSTATGSETTSGITFTFPLYPFHDPREKQDGVEAVSKAREEVIGKAIPLLAGLRSAQARLKAVIALHDAHKGNVEYLKKRVDAGVDYQKNFFGDYLTYLKAKNELDDLTSQVATNTASLLALVDPKNRAELKAMIEGREPGEAEDKKKDEEPETQPETGKDKGQVSPEK